MRKAGLIVSVVALLIGSSVAFAESESVFSPNRSASASEVVMSVTHVTRLKAALKLTAQQEQLWPAIEHAFREISQAQEAVASQGIVQGIKHRVTSIGLNTSALRRLASAAYPLIRTLNEEQKQNGLAFARSVGLESVAAAF